MAPPPSVITSSRTLLLGRDKTFADLRKKRRAIAKTSSPFRRVQTARTDTPTTQEQLARSFVELVKSDDDDNNQDDAYGELALQISLLRRTLRFSSRKFINLWLDELQQTGVRLFVSYHHLVSAVKCSSTLSLVTFVERADRNWLFEQMEQLFQDDRYTAVSNDYMEAIIDVSYSAKDLSIIKSLCSKNHADMLSSNSACLQLLQVLQDSNRLKMLSPKERQGIVIQVIFNPLVQIEPEKRTVTVQDILSAKSNALLKAQAMIDSPILQLVALWFGECNHLTQPASSWPCLYAIILDKLAFAEEATDVQFDLQFLLSLYAVVCQRLAQSGEQGFPAIVELLAALNQKVTDEIAAGIRATQFTAIVTFVQILLHHTRSIVGVTYQQWFQETFADPATTKLHSKRIIHRFLNELEKAIEFELPAVLQIQARVLRNNTHLKAAHFYVTRAKSKLRILGLDVWLQAYPQSIIEPEQVTGETGAQFVEDYVRDAVMHYSRTGTMPPQLLTDAIFRGPYYRDTILPGLLSWPPARTDPNLREARDALFKFLRYRQKVPDNIYNEFLRQQRR
ncbi:hypothetical protein VTP01DRAFT_7747 [Rhizomucor pusillus]|uniref:uncharacterized protein n=1 Tax=Rhizomucor pusillus TaxID=4840 RepID=UPI003743C3AD